MKKVSLACGMFAAIIYVGTVILGGLLRPDYSHAAEAISELVAAGAPNRTLLSSLFLVYNGLLTLFGVGLYLKARSHPRGQVSGIVGALAIALLAGMSGVLMELFFPQDPGGLPTTTPGTIHFVLAGTASLGTMIGVFALGIWFRNFPELKGYAVFSFIAVLIIFVSGGLTVSALANNHPLFGVSERFTIGAFILWLFIISLKLSRIEAGKSASP